MLCREVQTKLLNDVDTKGPTGQVQLPEERSELISIGVTRRWALGVNWGNERREGLCVHKSPKMAV